MHAACDEIPAVGGATYQLWFVSLFREGRALSFPCDAQGVVDLDALSERARNNYLLARAAMGRDYAMPTVAQVRTPAQAGRTAWRSALRALGGARWA